MLAFFLTALSYACAAQGRLGYIDTVSAERPFYYYYAICGLGSNFGNILPMVQIKGNTMVYKLNQNTYYGKPEKEPDTICVVQLPDIVIDSLVSLVLGTKDSSSFDSDPMVMSGSVCDMAIAVGRDTLSYELLNTTNEITERTLEILNTYLPAEHRFSDRRYMIKDAKAAWKEMREKEDKENTDKKKQPATKGTPYQWK